MGAEAQIDFNRDIQPLLAQRCYRCHGPDKAEGGLKLNEHERALAELDSGEHAIVPGKPDASALVARVASEDEASRMPPEGKPLKPAEVALLRRWIDEGAVWKKPWAFGPVAKPQPPAVANAARVSNPIDAFVLKRLEEAKLTPAAPADPAALVRRVYYDLTGLPPTPEEVDAFAADSSPEAYERLVDKLLESPRYGERWGRHWLDLVRYADTNSFERDGVKPNAWKYRDYVVRAFNDDKPYDQFVREQLAGDELSPASAEALIATGYYRLGLWDDEPADRLQARYDELDDIVATTGQVFLGLTVNCARCHDHKLDPIPQTDYYSLLSFFHELDSYGHRGDGDGPSQTDVSPAEVAAKYRELAEQKREVRKHCEELERIGIVKMSAEDQRQTEGGDREKVLREKLQANLDPDDWKQYVALKTKRAELEAVKLPPRETVMSVGRCLPGPPKTFVLMRGNPHVEGQEVAPAFLSVLGGGRPEIPPRAKSSGRRLALADWIASPANPLTARVMVNRIWQHHFGRGIVRSTSNFGSLGDPPTHPELLDWLSGEFVERGWRMKPLHRLILTSNVYRMASTANAAGMAKDPGNDLFWRFDMRRLGAEEMRDSILAVTGQLNLKMYGPGVYPEISAEVLASQSQPGSGWPTSPPEEQARRSVYVHVKRSLLVPILSEFDFCDTDSSCSVRFATTQPTQALGMLNGQFAGQQAQALAERLRREAGEDREAQVRRALRLALGRQPDAKSVERGLRLLQSLETDRGASPAAALKLYCLMVLNLNEFAYLD
ncbi:MAG TPA: PSD1 and planctomycete cytochrome C domain-containing protein [Pirellulales bacterium]|nr:PSD1 and planctomycete cytochrome C domain-containing protein [Pirellulales bacterium]